ncbi:MAG: hypothetical protein ACRD2I_09655, partial [Vicinamibacterales bacterium]
MRAVAAIPAIGLLAGAAFGLLVSDLPQRPTVSVLIACGALAVWAWRADAGRVFAMLVVAGFFTGGALLAADAWRQAWRPSLRLAFERVAAAQRSEAAAEGRRLPEDDEALLVVEGLLRADASPSESGVSLSVDVDSLPRRDGGLEQGWDGRDERETFRISEASAERPVSGGIVVSVVGSLAAERMGDWRAGRRVRFPVTLRRPSR